MGKKKQVLVVEDIESNRLFLKMLLSDIYIVHEAADGKEALHFLRAQGNVISVILLDLMMPNMDGFEFMQIIKQDCVLREIPIIVVTAMEDMGSEEQALRSGAIDFIQKPYNPVIIKQRMNNIIALHESAFDRSFMERDSLTGLYNRESFYLKAKRAMNEDHKNSYAILAFNLDNFKLINDIFGHEQGDELLRYMAGVISDEYTDRQIIKGRINGDEFMVCLPYKRRFTTSSIENILYRVKQYTINFRVIVRCGVFFVEEEYLPVSIMCDRAKLALNSIKGLYDNYIAFYTDQFRETLLWEQRIVNEMKRALTHREFEIYYQGKFDLETGQIVGAEALTRWNHPVKGLISPDNFISIFEKNGFITTLDLYVAEICCQHMSEWRKQGQELLPISINISRVDLYAPYFIDSLLSILKKYQISVELLELEITETVYSDNTEQVLSIMETLKNHGFTIEMDDFGSGYSSLKMLSDVPFDIIKLDMQF